MNKARVILFAIALFALLGGVLAFKTMRTGDPVFTTTTHVAAFGTFYTLAGFATFYYTRIDVFFTVAPNGTVAINVIRTTAVATAILILTRIGGTQTITIPNYGTVTAITTTRVTSLD